MDKFELKQIKLMALNYCDPLRGKILYLIAENERLTEENEKLRNEFEAYKKRAAYFEQEVKCMRIQGGE